MFEKALSGFANRFGFIVGGWSTWTPSKGFRLNSKLENAIINLSGWLLGLFLWIALRAMFVPEISLIRSLLGFVCFLSLLLIVIRFFIVGFIKIIKQWHSCEHRVIALVNSGLELTLENLKKMSPLHLKCESQKLFVGLVVYAIGFWLFVFTGINVFISLLIVIGISFILSVMARIVIFPTQRLILKNPTQTQLQEALRVAKEFAKYFSNPWDSNGEQVE